MQAPTLRSGSVASPKIIPASFAGPEKVPNSGNPWLAANHLGLKEQTVEGIGFQRLAIFRPGIIACNAHTPGYVAWLGRLIPGRFGTIEQDDIGRAFVAEFIDSPAQDGVVYLENGAMRQMSRAFK